MNMHIHTVSRTLPLFIILSTIRLSIWNNPVGLLREKKKEG